MVHGRKSTCLWSWSRLGSRNERTPANLVRLVGRKTEKFGRRTVWRPPRIPRGCGKGCFPGEIRTPRPIAYSEPSCFRHEGRVAYQVWLPNPERRGASCLRQTSGRRETGSSFRTSGTPSAVPERWASRPAGIARRSCLDYHRGWVDRRLDSEKSMEWDWFGPCSDSKNFG